MTGREYLNQIRDTDLNIRCKEREIFKNKTRYHESTSH